MACLRSSHYPFRLEGVVIGLLRKGIAQKKSLLKENPSLLHLFVMIKVSNIWNSLL